MTEGMLTFIYFIVAAISFWLAVPYSIKLAIRIISNYRIRYRMRIVSKASSTMVDDDDNDEDIGLNKKGPILGANKLFNYIADHNRGLIEEMKELLQKAGMRQEHALEEFMKSKFTSSIALFFIIFLLITTNDFGIPILLSIVIALVISVIGGHKLTNMDIERIAEKRREAIENGVPDLIDLLVICTESGLDLNRAIRRVAKEMRTSNPMLSDELSLTAIELEMIPDHRQVFTNLENRTDCLAIKTLSKTFSQSIEYGSSLADSLRALSIESRQKRMLAAEARAAQAPTLLTLPMMFFIMPCLFIVMLGPVIVGMISSFSSK